MARHALKELQNLYFNQISSQKYDVVFPSEPHLVVLFIVGQFFRMISFEKKKNFFNLFVVIRRRSVHFHHIHSKVLNEKFTSGKL